MKSILIEKKYSLWFCLPAVLIYSLFFVLPTIGSFILSFTDWSIYNFNKFEFNGLDNFKEIINASIIKTSITNTIYFAIVTVVLKSFLGLVLALIINDNLKFTNFYKGTFFMPVVLSPIVVCVIFSAIYNPQNGILNVVLRWTGLGFLANDWLNNTKFAMNAICMMDIWQWTGFGMAIYLAALKSVPKEYYEAAMIDGAGYIRQMVKVTFPLIMPAFTVNIVLNIIGGLKVFAQVYGLTNGGPNDATQVFSTLIYKNFGLGLFGQASAINLIFTLFVSVLGITATKYLRSREVEY